MLQGKARHIGVSSYSGRLFQETVYTSVETTLVKQVEENVSALDNLTFTTEELKLIDALALV